MNASPGKKREWSLELPLFGLVLLAMALRVARLAAQDLWGDEAYSAWLALQPPSGILQNLAQGEPHPPFYPLLLWLWVKVAGHGEFALRYASALFGVAIVPLVAALGRRLQGRQLALAAAFVTAINPFMIWYSQETRMYIAVAAFAAWAAAALLRGLDGGRWVWLEFAIAATLMIYTHYYGLLVLGAYGLLIAGSLLRHKLPARPWLSALVLIAVLYLPWVSYASRIFFGYSGVAPGRVDLWGVFGGFWLRSSVGWAFEQRDAVRWLPLFLLLSLLGLSASLGVRHAAPHRPRRSLWRPALLLGWLLVPLAGGLLISVVRPMYAERYLIVSTLPFLLLIGWGLVLLRRWWPAHVAALLLLLVATFFPLRSQYLDHRYVKSEYSHHTDEVQGLALPRDGVILDAPSQGYLFGYYYTGPLPHYPLPRDVPLVEDATAAELRELAARHSGLWLFLYATHDYDPGDFVEKWLSNNAFRAWHTWTINGQLDYYANYRREDLVDQRGSARFGERLELRGFAARAQPYAAGEVIPLLFNWRAIAAPERDYKISLRLRDADGFLWGQTDAEPVTGFRPTGTWKKDDEVEDRLGVLILPGTPPGRYSMELRVYPPGGEPLPVTSDGLAVTGSALTLGEVQVARAGTEPTGIGIPAFQRIGALFGGQVALEGESGMGEVAAGQAGYLTLLWRALQKPVGDYEARLRLVDRQGRTGAEITARPVNGQYSLTQWQPGDVLRWQYNLRVGPTTPPGEYRLRLSLVPAGGQALPVSRLDGSRAFFVGDEVDLQRLVVKPRVRQAANGKPQVELRAVLGGKVGLKGYSIEPSAPVPGGKLALTLYWEPLAESDVAFTVFTHLLDGSAKIWAQQDGQPCGGGCPTTAWLPGDLVEDRYELTVKPDAPPGQYEIELGMYDAASGRRLSVLDAQGRPAGDRVLLPKVWVGPQR